MAGNLRSPICSVLGHVDHGKSSILDAIRDSCIVAKEAGAITQAIGASIVPVEILKKKCGKLLEAMKITVTIPGLLFIDTPGHAAFTSLRKRGGNLADIAILVVDINEGFKPQTIEALEILKFYKTPFIVAANKIDLISGWQSKQVGIIQEINSQRPQTITAIETKLYELVGKLSEYGFNSERFDRVDDFTKEIGIIPVSAKTREGLPELMMMITGLAQKYLEQNLKVNIAGPAKGTILEVKEEKGLGVTMDVIIYDGIIKVNDQIVIGGVEAPIVTKVRALLEPMPLAEMRDVKSKFKPVKEAVAATGVKISAPDIENVVAGMPLRVATKDTLEQVKDEITEEIENVMIETDNDGIIIKADTIGSLEALTNLLQGKNIPIRKAMVGDISKKDVSDAQSNYEADPLTAVILGFNIKVSDEVKSLSPHVKILTNDVIYRLIEDFEKWQEGMKKALEASQLDVLTRPCKFKIMPNYVFRQSNPAIVGADILNGRLKTGAGVMKDGKTISTVKEIQAEKENLSVVEQGKQVAVALTNVTVGRQIHENDILYTYIPESDFKKLKELKEYLTRSEIEALKEIAEIMRKQNPVWGI
ncbi:MAG: translation initiation factor IF-2 [Nanoarchaeota archaeon]|nr:translation initiation factor IF-2 [Nanoarchaeota archaeon]